MFGRVFRPYNISWQLFMVVSVFMFPFVRELFLNYHFMLLSHSRQFASSSSRTVPTIDVALYVLSWATNIHGAFAEAATFCQIG